MNNSPLTLKRLDIDTYKESVIYMHKDCHVCRSEGFVAHSRVEVSVNGKKVIATLNVISNHILEKNEVSLSMYAWELLDAKEGELVHISHPPTIKSLSYVRAKVYGNSLLPEEINEIIQDITHGMYSDINLATFLTACAGGRLNINEIIALTQSMLDAGEKLSWPSPMVADKHCVGGLPGNRTTLIVVPIVTAFGMTMPKTSSRAITSPAGTADTMEVLAPVSLSLNEMKKVVDKEGGCIVWGGSVSLSPADDILITVERAMNLDTEGQLIASVFSKKIAAGATHLVIDIPVGETAKVRTHSAADMLSHLFNQVASHFNIDLRISYSNGVAPVGWGIGPALEAQDVLAVLHNHPQAPQDLRERSLSLAGQILEFSPEVPEGKGYAKAAEILNSGEALKKFMAICEAQGGFHEPENAPHSFEVLSNRAGKITSFDNRRLAVLAKLAGAPHYKTAGVKLHVKMHEILEKGQPLLTLYAESEGALNYAKHYLETHADIITIAD